MGQLSLLLRAKYLVDVTFNKIQAATFFIRELIEKLESVLKES